ncbi:MAG: tRNA threonylcarbamoyladenosine dehydratase [Clostridia bacterium]|nr:tRNA threonylcarbamoyladenosine dehydratase [Clostridia bacterium]
MSDRFIRAELLLGAEAMHKLKNAHVAVFGIGGVGGYAVEALARSGVGELTLVDADRVDISNINRQIIALTDTVGMMKTEAAARRIAQINPDCAVHIKDVFYLPETAGEFDFSIFDHVIDAVDTVSAKLSIVTECDRLGVPVISAMGAGNKLDPTAFEVADISETSVCPLARVMRKELRKRGIEHLKVVYSKEEAAVPDETLEEEALRASAASGSTRRSVPGSVAFVPSVAGLILAGEVVKDLVFGSVECGE